VAVKISIPFISGSLMGFSVEFTLYATDEFPTCRSIRVRLIEDVWK